MRGGDLASVEIMLRCSKEDAAAHPEAFADLDQMYELYPEALLAAVAAKRGDMLRALVFQGRPAAAVAGWYRKQRIERGRGSDDIRVRCGADASYRPRACRAKRLAWLRQGFSPACLVIFLCVSPVTIGPHTPAQQVLQDCSKRAVSSGFAEGVRILLVELGLPHAVPGRMGDTLLHNAAEAGHEQCVVALLRAGVEVEEVRLLLHGAVLRAAPRLCCRPCVRGFRYFVPPHNSSLLTDG